VSHDTQTEGQIETRLTDRRGRGLIGLKNFCLFIVVIIIFVIIIVVVIQAAAKNGGSIREQLFLFNFNIFSGGCIRKGLFTQISS
jgi:hypothetical protein